MQKDNNGVQVLSNIVASSASLQAKYGGVIPEQAAREQLKSIVPVIETAINDSGLKVDEIDAIAVTAGPGLIGSLLVGVETAKVLSKTWQKPLVPVNHLVGHFYANWVNSSVSEYRNIGISEKSKPSDNLTPRHSDTPTFPAIGLLISGGHTDLILMKDHGKYEYLGGTRDDAAGETFDKTARLLGLPYPGGPQISKAAEFGNPVTYGLPRPMISSDDFDFSFSGLKTAVSNLATRGNARNDHKFTNNLAASVQAAIIDVLIKKTLRAIKLYDVKQVVVAGGVAANQKLRKRLTQAIQMEAGHVKISIPPVNLCTDNAVYIATAAFFNYHPTDPLTLQANPNLSLGSSDRKLCFRL